MTIPETGVLLPDYVEAQWLDSVLKRAGALSEIASVTAVAHEPCGTGQLADTFRFTVRYAPDGAGPASVVGKFAAQDTVSREFGRQSGFYRTEIRFYAELAADLHALVLPRVYHAELAPNEIDFVLLMEDLAPARTVDQLTGVTPDEAALVVEQLAALHAGSWGNTRLAQAGWLRGAVDSFGRITDGFPETVAAFPERFGDLIPEADIAQAARLNEHLDAWRAIIDTPLCLWHSDARADNLLFDAKDGRLPVVLLDWQGVGYGYGPIDLAYFLGTSLTVEDRRRCERDLVALYQRRLAALGVRDYSAEQAWAD